MAEQSVERLRAGLAELEQEIAQGEEELGRIVGADDSGIADIAHQLARLRALYSRWIALESSLEALGEPVSTRRRR